jgi:hypothetical protein
MSVDFENSSAANGLGHEAKSDDIMPGGSAGLKLLPIVRSRHGRPIRRVSLSPLFAATSSRANSFEEIVKITVDFIKTNYAEELGELKYEILDAPSLRSGATRVRRWAVKSDDQTIVIYRLPIERFGGHRRKSAFEARMSIEFQVFSAAANLIGREPDFFLRG